MRALVVYESLYGNTHTVAERIGDGLRQVATEVQVASVHDVTRAEVLAADLLVVGGPTHVHGMASERTRLAARRPPRSRAAPSGWSRTPKVRACGSGSSGPAPCQGSAELPSTRGCAVRRCSLGERPGALPAGSTIEGVSSCAPPESFLVDKASRLVDGEAERAEAWGRSFADVLVMGA